MLYRTSDFDGFFLGSVQKLADINTAKHLRVPLKVADFLRRSDYQLVKGSAPYIWLICTTINCEKYILKG
jgi:hypothetical protein